MSWDSSPTLPRLLALACIILVVAGIWLAFAHPGAAPWLALLGGCVAGILGVRRSLDIGRLRRLRAVARAYADGRLDQRADIHGVGSIPGLAADLNLLGERLAVSHAALDEQRRLLDGALGSLTEGVACIAPLDQVVYANPVWRHLAAGGGEVLGSPFYEHLPAAALAAAVAACRGGGEPAAVEFEHRRRRLRATVARGPGVVVAVLHDLTELKRLEGARRDFVSAISHELKTPLTAIAGYAETLLDGAVDEPAVARPFVEKIARHAERLTVLVRDVLTLSRLEQGAWEVKPERFDLVELGQAILDEHVPAADERQVRLTLDAPGAVEAHTDRELLRQLIGNLVSNAVRYNRPSGTVRLAIATSAERLRITVADTGIGIPTEHRERIFDRFFRVDAHRSRQSGGTGLGLAIVRQLAETLKGEITLDSSPQGTTFTVLLPRIDPRVAASMRTTEPGTSTITRVR